MQKKAVLIATRNAHKALEIKSILGAQFEFFTLDAFPGAPNVNEDAMTFAGNATKKAVELARWLANAGPDRNVDMVMADDSGLEVDALKGAPGVHSARFAAMDSGKAGNSTDAENRAKLLRVLKDVPLEKRTGRFRCVIAVTLVVVASGSESASPVCYADEIELRTQTAEGTCEGRIALEPKGHGGFGYDPLFIPHGFTQTFAELGEDLKNQISHRAKALGAIREMTNRDW